MKKYFIFFFLISSLYIESDAYFSSTKNITYNALGVTGLIYTPSAETHEEKSVFFTFNKNEIWKLGTITVTPFNWLEASYFYYRPDDLYWGSAVGLYLDKGFNVKLSYKPKIRNLPNFAIGLDDFAGTGQFTREYIATTFPIKSTKISFGIGWGKYAGKSSFKNPLSFIGEEIEFRPSGFSNLGGTPEYGKWFRGDASVFGGLEWSIPNSKGLKFKIELDPYDYLQFSCCGEGKGPNTDSLRKKDSKINLGISFPLNDYGNIDLAFVKGNTISLSFSFGITADRNNIKRKKFEPKIEKTNFNTTKKESFYRDLLHNLNLNNIYLQTADLKDNNISITIDSPDLRNSIQASSRAARIAKETAAINNYETDFIDVGYILRGIEIRNIKYQANDLGPISSKLPEIVKRNTTIQSVDPYKYKRDEFRPIVNFPVFFNSINPDIRSHVGSPEKFLYSGIGFSLDNETQFNRRLVLSSSIGINLNDNFDQKISDPNSIVRHVRTEILNYLQEGSVYLKRLQLDYMWSPKENIYTKVSAGILEEMYGGAGIEFLYKPFDQNFSLGYEFYRVKRRTYEQRFEFFNQEEDINTNHLNLSYMLNQPQILIKYSYGNYLAGDKGYTLDLSRYSNIGWKAGFYFTRTDMSYREFGEGSFDKGFYFQIPNDVLFQILSKGNIGLSLKTMTRDGGQKLELHNKLEDFFINTNKHEINMGWHGFYN